MNLDSLKFYASISSLRVPKTYRGKIMLVAFIGIHVPLITLIFYTSLSSSSYFNISATLLITLFATSIATAATLYTLARLLSPIVLTSKTLRHYLRQRQINHLPTNFQDEVGTLMADTNRTLQRLDAIIKHLTNYDSLTGLPNRELFQLHLQEAISKTVAENQQFALIVLDIDSLKDINSTLGRLVGDLLLKQVAQRLTNYLSAGDMLARFGGDEFAVLRTNINNSDSAIALSNQLLDSLSTPFSLYGRKIHCTAKIGITIYPFDGTSIEQLLQNADTAIHQAKQQKLNTYQFYSPVINAKLKRVLAIKENLRYALKRGELSIQYQPRIEIATGKMVAVEALLRWYNPELGFVSPGEFIPIAEETNLIIPIGEWVLRHACRQNKQWQQEGLAPLRVSVNLSTCQFKQVNLIETIDRILQETQLDVTCLELEITESLLAEDIQTAITLLWKLKRRGITIALDDFGTGYSSLSYLQKLPIDTLKIDRSFVTNIASNPDDAAISRAIVALAHSLELNITAEGVETKEQFDYLQNQGCHEVQGYYFSKPLSGDRLKDFLVTYQ